MTVGPNSMTLNSKELNNNSPEKHNYSLLCPFRKRTYFMETRGKQEFNTSSSKAEFIEEEFLPCIKEKCMRFNRVTGCGI